MKVLVDNLTVVIRSVGERTEGLCQRLACDQVPEANVVVIRERPFGAAVRKTFQVGLERGLRWTLALDADVLLRANAIRDMLAWAQIRTDEFFLANFSVADKFLGRVREGGGHLYRTKLVDKALARAGPDIDGHERPESLVRARMGYEGYPAFQLHGLIVGLHDFEQSYRDIYRTTYVHQMKHPAADMTACRAAWRRLAKHDPDFRVASIGAEAAAINGGAAVIDDRRFPALVSEIDPLSDMQEKPPLRADSFDLDAVSLQVGQFSPFPEGFRVKDMSRYDRDLLDGQPTFGQRLRAAINGVGVARFPLLACGSVLRKTGDQVVRVANRNRVPARKWIKR
ncbi:MAG: hypothetical protein R6U98_34585 [Pirellulaceae bacterium]